MSRQSLALVVGCLMVAWATVSFAQAPTKPATYREILAAREAPNLETLVKRSSPQVMGEDASESSWDLLKLRRSKMEGTWLRLEGLFKDERDVLGVVLHVGMGFDGHCTGLPVLSGEGSIERVSPAEKFPAETASGQRADNAKLELQWACDATAPVVTGGHMEAQFSRCLLIFGK